MNDEYDGAPVFDGTDDKVGTVERTYIDDSNTVRFVAVRTGTLLHQHHLIPADSARFDQVGLHLPYTRAAIEEGPTISDPEDTLEGDILTQTREYYDGSVGGDVSVANEADTASRPIDGALETDIAPTATTQLETPDIPSVPAASGETIEQLSQVRDLGDVIEVPVVEERLVRQPYVREVVRVKKSRFTDASTVAADVRKERVEVDSDEGVLANNETETLDT